MDIKQARQGAIAERRASWKGAQVFVAEAFYDLVVAVVAAHHQELLEGLRALRQRVKLAFVHAAGHHKVARAFGGAFDQEGRLQVHEALAVQKVAHGAVDPVAQGHVALQGRPAEVQVPILHAQLFAAVGFLLNGERRRGGVVQHGYGVDQQLNVAGGQLLVFGVALNDLAAGLQHGFAADGLDQLQQLRLCFSFFKDQLGHTVPVAQHNPADAALLADILHPAGEGGLVSGVKGAQFAAGMGTVHVRVGG